MQKKGKLRFNIKVVAVTAVLAAFSIVLGKYLAINLSSTIRLSFENLPIILASFYFGPMVGAGVGIVADLVGCLLVGYTINPIITLGAAVIGICAGIATKLPIKNALLKTAVVVVAPHILGSVIIKTVGLVWFFKLPFLATLAGRLLTYIIICVFETAILYALSKNRALSRQMQRFKTNAID